MDWLQKYRPIKIDDIVCNKQAVIKIKNWITDFDTNKKEKRQEKKNKNNNIRSCILITGSHGVGKTLGVEVILREYNYEIHRLDFNDIKNTTNIKESILKLVNNNNILNLINNNTTTKIAIVIDELESITSTTEKNCILNIQKSNEINWFCPIIFISNNQHNKLLSEIKKNSIEIKFYQPFDTDMKKILGLICNKEKIKIHSMEVVDKIIEHSQYDIRRLINTIQDIYEAYPNQIINMEVIEEYTKTSKVKDIDIDLFTATAGLLYNYETINDCLRFYETEKVLLPLMVHQNYAKTVIDNVNNKEKQYEITKDISKSLSTGDVIENYIYGDQNWEMQEIHGFYTCVDTSFKLHNNMGENIKRSNLTFTTDLNKTSIKKINKKNINNTNKCFNNLNIFDYIYINKIIRKLIKNNKIEECMELLKHYDIKMEHIESLLKIDKIKNTKTNLTSKQKKEFQKYIQN